jgi:hypothetical protein
MRGRLQMCAVGVAMVASALGAGGAEADRGARVDLDIGFTTTAPATATGMTFHILYKDEAEPDAKPKPFDELILDTPAGTRFDGAALPRCVATDQQLQTLGRAACPPDSEVGRGTLTAMTGFGAPVDPVVTDVTLYNGGDQIVEVVTQQGGDAPLGFDRLFIEGSRLHAHPPVIPGGPPEGRTAVRQIDIRVEPHGDFVTTPPTCPASRLWTASGTVAFIDGVTETVATRAPCVRAAGTGGAMSVRVTPRRVRTGRTVRFRVVVSSSSSACRQGVTVRVGGRRAKTGADGRATITARLGRPGRRRLRAAKAGCGSAVAAVRVLRPARFAG